MRKITRLLLPLISIFLISCSTIPDHLPWVYRLDIQQGNIIDQDMIDQLRPNMSKRQVLYILGSPMLIDVFHQKRWDYIYSEDLGDKPRQQQRISLYFEDEILTGVQGDYRPSEIAVARVNTDTTVDVPKRQEKKTVFGEIVKFFSFSDDEETTSKENQEEDQKEPELPAKEIETLSEQVDTKESLNAETPATDTENNITEEIKEQVIADEKPADTKNSEAIDSEQQPDTPETNETDQNISPDTPVADVELKQANDNKKQPISDDSTVNTNISETIQPEPKDDETKETVTETIEEDIAEQEAKAKEEQEEKFSKELEELTKPPVLIPEQK